MTYGTAPSSGGRKATIPPAVFDDSAGGNWELKLNLHTARRVKDGTGFDLLAPTRGDWESLERLQGDRYVLCDVLWHLCQDDAERLGLDEFDFAERIGDADVIDAAAAALFIALIGFFPANCRPILLRILQKIQTGLNEKQAAAVERLNAEINSPEFDEKLERFDE